MWKKILSWWVPSSEELLEESEALMFDTAYLKCKAPTHAFVDITVDLRDVNPDRCDDSVHNLLVHTIKVNETDYSKPALVMVHGFGGGVGVWTKNLAELSQHFRVYAFDVPGFGRSTKPQINNNISHKEAEAFFVESLEQWRDQIGLREPFHLLGHSMGGFITSAYTEKYPKYVKHLILVSPFGCDVKAESDKNTGISHRISQLPRHSRAVVSLAQWMARKAGVMSIVRLAGPFGPKMMERRRQYDISRYDFPDERAADYVYYLMAQCRGGDIAFWSLHDGLGKAHAPIIPRAAALTMPITMIYGELDFMKPQVGEELLSSVPHDKHSLTIVPGAGHHPYASDPGLFAKAIVSDLRKHFPY